MKFKIVNMLDVVCDYIEVRCKKEKLSPKQLFKKYPGTKRILHDIQIEQSKRILYSGKWRAGWLTPENKLLASTSMHHYDILYLYFYGDTKIPEKDDMFRDIIRKGGWSQLWNGSYLTSSEWGQKRKELTVDTQFGNIDTIVNLVVNFPPMYKIFDRIIFSTVVRGREVRRVTELKESGVEEVGFSLVNPRR